MSKCEEMTIIIHPDTFDMCDEHLEVALVGFAGRPGGDPRFVLASIKDLRLDVSAQLRWLELGIHPDGEVQGFGFKDGEIVWVEEGAFKWGTERLNYVLWRFSVILTPVTGSYEQYACGEVPVRG